ncbi:MAG TPA: hypothetical protein VIT20_02525 [Propionibacteriaceae bacterium]
MTASTGDSMILRRPALNSTLPWLSLTWLSVVLALNLAMDQLSRLSGTVLDTAQRAWSFGELMGPSALASRAGWMADFGDDTTRPVELATYLALDLVFIVLYGIAVRRIIRRRYVGVVQRVGLLLLGALIVVDLLEDVLAARTIAVGRLGEHGSQFLAGVSTVKIVLGVAVAALGIYALVTPGGQSVRKTARLVYEVVRQHRLTVVPLLVVAVMALGPGADILDQAPDIERRWSDTGRTFVIEGGLGLAVLVLVAVTLFLLGRARSQIAARDADTAPRRRPRRMPLGWWLVGPGILVVVAVVLAGFGAPVTWARVVIFCVPAAVIFGFSKVLRVRSDRVRMVELRLAREEHRKPLMRPPHRPKKIWTHRELELLVRTGDGLAIGVLAVGALGAIRSMTSVVMLWILGLTPFNGRALVLLVLGLVGTALLWWLVELLRTRLTGAYDDTQTSPWRTVARWLVPDPISGRTPMRKGFPEVLAFGSLGVLLAMGLFPRTFGSGGVLFVFNLGLLGLTGLIAGAGLVAARTAPAEIFTRMHLRSTPVISLVIVAVLFAGEVGSTSPIHAVRTTPAGVTATATDQRPTLATAIQTWATRQTAAGCGRPVTASGRQVEVLPMVMLGAEGGGIRAAYWTVKAVDQLASDACAQRSVAFSSGVSGGAVGLAVLRFNREPMTVVEQMSDSRALSRGLVGLLVRDFGYATTGVALPELSEDHPTDWMDRAALMEQAWNTATTTEGNWRDVRFAQPRPAAEDEPTGVGSIILNSMSVGNACRVWVSEVQLRSPKESVGGSQEDKIRCDQAGASGLRSIDLLSAYGSPQAGTAAASPPSGCLTGLTASTAAMLAARFPYVTPSGRIGPCTRSDGSEAPVDQLVDGGYLENTGLGTINDLADDWLPVVQAWNTAQLAKPATAVPQLIVPMIGYLNNDTGNDQSAPRRDITSEALVPPLARLRAKSDGVADDLTLQRSADLVRPANVCGVASPVCTEALDSLGHHAFMIYPGSQPQIAAPLGWVLSQASRTSMDQAMVDQAKPCPATDDASIDLVCRRGFGTLGDLLATVSTPKR